MLELFFELLLVGASLCGSFSSLEKAMPYETDPGVVCEIVVLEDGSVTEVCRP